MSAGEAARPHQQPLALLVDQVAWLGDVALHQRAAGALCLRGALIPACNLQLTRSGWGRC